MVIDPVLDLSLWITLCSVGFIAGLIDAIAGGGGMLTVPTLLTSGLPPHVACSIFWFINGIYYFL